MCFWIILSMLTFLSLEIFIVIRFVSSLLSEWNATLYLSIWILHKCRVNRFVLNFRHLSFIDFYTYCFVLSLFLFIIFVGFFSCFPFVQLCSAEPTIFRRLLSTLFLLELFFSHRHTFAIHHLPYTFIWIIIWLILVLPFLFISFISLWHSSFFSLFFSILFETSHTLCLQYYSMDLLYVYRCYC